MHRYMKDVTLARSENARIKSINNVKLEEKNVLKQLNLIEKRFLGDKNRIIKLREKFILWEKIRNQVIALAKNKKYQDAASITTGKGAKYVDTLISDFNGILEYAKNKAAHFLYESETEYNESKAELLIIGFTILIISLIFWFYIINKIYKNQKQLQESEEQFRSAFENVAIGNIVINSKGIIEVYNSAAQSIFGYKADKVIGQNVKMLMPQHYQDNHDAYIKRYLKTKKAHIIGVGREVIGKRENGEEFPMHLGIGEMTIQEKTLFIASINDLTDIKKIDRQLQKKQQLEAVGQLTGGIAHDYNNLLAVIMGNLELALNKIDSDNPLTKNLEQCLSSANRAAILTQQLLSYSGQQDLRPEVINSDKLIHDTAEFLNRTLSENIKITAMADIKPLNIFVDRATMGTVFLNIALNSRDAMPNGGKIIISNSITSSGEIEKYFEHVKPGPYVCIRIQDTGSGVNDKSIPHIFEPFYTTKGVGKGSGLGLSMVYGFIRQSHGYIRVESEKNVGTDVYMYLPLIQEEQSLTRNDLQQTKFNYHIKTVLLVEDDVAVAETTGTLLEELGYSVIIAYDADQALNLIEKNKNDIGLVISDVRMPGNKNGFDLAKEISLNYKPLNILLISGYPENIAKREILAKENLHLLPKPFSQIQLMNAISEVMEGTNWQIT